MLWVLWIVEQEYRLVSWSTFTTDYYITILFYSLYYIILYGLYYSVNCFSGPLLSILADCVRVIRTFRTKLYEQFLLNYSLCVRVHFRRYRPAKNSKVCHPEGLELVGLGLGLGLAAPFGMVAVQQGGPTDTRKIFSMRGKGEWPP